MTTGERIVVVVQARMGSARLPNKSMRIMCGYPMVAHVLRRASACGYQTILATSLNERDGMLAEQAWNMAYRVVRGSEWDVLSRIALSAELYRADVVVRVTGDCPLWAPDVGVQVVQAFLDSDRTAIVSNDTTTSGWPDGLDVEVFSAEMLYAANDQAQDARDREHVTPWMRREAKHVIVRHDQQLGHVKLSVDTAEDFIAVAQVMAEIDHRHDSYDWATTQRALERLGRS